MINTLGPDLFSAADFKALDDLVVDLRNADGAGVRTKLADVNSINDRSSIPRINGWATGRNRISALVIGETTLRIDELLIREDDPTMQGGH